jgi:hypothetical protein
MIYFLTYFTPFLSHLAGDFTLHTQLKKFFQRNPKILTCTLLKNWKNLVLFKKIK